ncbi:hypothetical protein [Parachitinimonas caeni]|uniref:Uncharacterized protein n=1 Tax=Parachitinimonas caeni TaxID=3031301 RepID=A0ABT7DZD0_9NEIS|nr:hypothetical protein [Parachitinimonas caeni]MDK2125354.1 hypothetical protein [Parachitinimonas caeni]
MTVQPVSTRMSATTAAPSAMPRQNPPAVAAKPAYAVNLSQAGRDRLAAEAMVTSAGSKLEFDTNHGAISLDVERYFTPPGSQAVNLDSLPILLPSRRNIDALSQFVSSKMPDFLAKHGIPKPPASITYDQAGQLQLPADYPHADAFKRALAEDPTMERALRTTAALTSHLVEMNKLLPFHQEYAAAKSQSDADAIVAKYRHLFSSHRHIDTISLNFSPDGQLSIRHDGKTLEEV